MSPAGALNCIYHTKSILTNQIAVFEGYNGSYLPPRHMPNNLVDQNSLEHGTSKLFPMFSG